MDTCKTCKHWLLKHPDFKPDFYHYELLGTYQTTTGKATKSEEQAIADTGYAARWCTKIVNVYEPPRPVRNGVSIYNEWEDDSAIATGQDFGCVLHEEI